MARNKFRIWLDETHGTQFELLRYFLSEQLVSDLIATDQVRRFVITVLAVLGWVGPLILIRLYLPKYRYLQGLDTGDVYLAAVRADRLFYISLSMAVAGLATVIQWHGLFPSRRDYLALKPLPIPLYQVFIARFLSSLIIVGVVIVDLNVVTSVLFPLLTSGKWQLPSYGIQYVAAHAIATLCAGLFVFFALNALQGLLMNLLPARAFAQLSVLIQVLFATLCVAAIPYIVYIPSWCKTIAARPRWMSVLPPAWFLALYETVLGEHDNYWLVLRRTGVIACMAGVFVTLATCFVSYRRCAARVLEQDHARLSGPGAITRLLQVLSGKLVAHPPTLAAFAFSLQTLRRSRYHKFVVGFCAAIALVFALQTAGPSIVAHLYFHESWKGWQIRSILALPLLIGAILISAFCYVFQLPSDVRAVWVFRMAEGTARKQLLNSVEYLLVLCGIVPSLIVSFPIEVLALGWSSALPHMALVTVLLLLLIELRLREWHKIPFTCSYVPGRRNFWPTLGTFLFLFAALIPTITYFEFRLLRPVVLLAGTTALSIFYAFLRSARQTQWGIIPLLFDENDEPLIEGVRLNRE